MHPGRYNNRLLLPMVLQVLVQTRVEALEGRARLQQVVLVVLEEVLDLLLIRGLDEALGPALRVVACASQLPELAVLLAEGPPDDVRNLVYQPQLLIVVEVSVNLLRDCQQRARDLPERGA